MHKSTSLGAALAICILVAMFLIIFLYTSAIDLALSTLLATIICLPGIGRLTRKADLFDPLVLMTLLFAIAIPLSVIYVVAQPESALATVFGAVPLAVLNKAMLLSSLAMGCLIAGFYLTARLRSRANGQGQEGGLTTIPDFIVARLMGLYWATVAIRLATLASGYGTLFVSATSGAGPLSNLMDTLSSLNNIVYPMALLVVFWNGDERSLKKALPLLVAQVGIGLLIASKAAALNAVIPFLFAYGIRRGKGRKSSWAIPALLAIALIATILVFPIISTYRSMSMAPSFGTLLSVIQAAPVGTSSIIDVLGRISWLSSIAKVIMAVPQHIPFAYGETIWPAFTWFVPRIIWSDKPMLSIGAWYAHEILGWDPLSRSEAAITLWGDAYLNFGTIGMVIAGFSMGLLFGYVYNILYRNVRHPYIAMVYFLFIGTFVLGFERNIASLVASFGQSFILSFIIWRVVTLKFKWERGSKKNIHGGGLKLSTCLTEQTK